MIIGLCGYARAGKDSVAKVLCEQFGFVKLAFADPLRAMALAIDPMITLAGADEETVMAIRKYPRAFAVQPTVSATLFNISVRYSVILDAIGYEQAKSIPDFRRFLQRLGTEGARDCLWPGIWIDAFAHNVARSVAEGHKNIVVTDVRFPNEAACITEQGELWRIDRPGCERGSHESESHVSLFAVHRVILNNTTLEDLEVRVRLAHRLVVFHAS